jgi:hypothetical protein
LMSDWSSTTLRSYSSSATSSRRLRWYFSCSSSYTGREVEIFIIVANPEPYIKVRKKPQPDPHQSEKQDPDEHQIEMKADQPVIATEARNEAIKAHNEAIMAAHNGAIQAHPGASELSMDPRKVY